MKKLSFALFVALCFFSCRLNGQIAYYDAIFLNNSPKSIDGKIILNNDVQKLLANYFPDVKHDQISAIKLNDSGNPFFKSKFTDQGSGNQPISTYIKKISSSAGSIEVTKLSQGVSLFLIARAKEELNIAFFEKFKKFVKDNPEVRILFPNTSDALSNLLAYQYAQMLPVLQEAFYKDLNIFPDNLVEVMLMDKYYKKMKEFPEFIVVLRSITLVQRINQMNPPQLVDSLPGIAKDFKKFPKLENLHSSLQLTTIFSNSIRTDSIHYVDSLKNYWISPKAFYKNVLSDSVTLNIFLGLIYQEIKIDSIKFNNNLMYTLVQKNNKEILWYKIQFAKLISQVDNINSAAKSIKMLQDEGIKPSNQDINSYINTSIDLFDFGYNFASHYNSKLKTDKLDKYIELAKNANSLYINTVVHNYTLAMNNAIFILNKISDTIVKNDIAIDTNIFKTKVIERLATYGTFIANMADADTPEQVQTAIETAALPAGSSSFKKNYRNNFALNAYLGVNAGNWPDNNSSSNTWNGNFRLTAPIGVTYTPIAMGKGGAVSAFVSLLDVGAIVDYQLSNDGKSVDQKIYLSNIFSPGGYLVYGFPGNLPLSFGVGGQYGPGLIKMGDNLWNPSWRWNLFLAVDIPIFNLNKGRGITK